VALATAPAPHAAAHSAPAASAAIPFTKASVRKTETFLDETRALKASAVSIPQVDVPATGWLRHLVLTVTCDSGDGATFHDDAPWNIIDSITFRDVNGHPVHTLSGFDLFLANLTGAYTQHSDPRRLPGYKADATGVKFQLRIPLEIIARGALGVLANTNSGMLYKLQIVLAPAADVFASNAPAAPSVRITGVVESWSNSGVKPPAEGTTQNWSEHVAPLVQGKNTVRFPRVGNAIRNLVLVNRDATGARTDALWPDEVGIFKDGNQWHQAPKAYFDQRAVELYGYDLNLPVGVLVLPFTDDFDGTPGEEMGDFWIQTTGATRLELQGVFKAAGALEILTNDILAVAAPGGAGATLGAQV
jgi:hypothetical protein